MSIALLLALLFAPEAKHFVYFGHERERIVEPSFTSNPQIAGAQLRYTWRALEPERDRYDFSNVLADITTLEQHGKKLWIQLQDVSFSENQVVPDYLLRDPAFHGGAARKFEDGRFDGWIARRWDPAVRKRFARLLRALAAATDGRIEGLNLAETAIGMDDPQQQPDGFTYAAYAEGVNEMLTAARRAFPRSHVVVYGNFMPGDPRREYLRGLYAHAERIGAGVGGPDILPHRRWQRMHSLALVRARKPGTVAGMAVQDGNLADINPATKQRVTVDELFRFATDTLRLDYIFWGTEEPYYTSEVLPYLKSLGVQKR